MRILGGEFKGRDLPTLDAKGCRPAMAKVRKSLFDMLAARRGALRGARVLDVFAGTGGLGLEAVSRGAAFAAFVERDRALARRIADNCRRLGLSPARFAVHNQDALKLLVKQPDHGYDIVFVDPPYGQDLLAPVLALLAERGWLGPGAMVTAEVEARLVVTDWPALLELELDRTYGQTRIYVWTIKASSPSIPEPSTP
ncbi:16S rRNA (guanine(966)-N(2))-methyltransferase RsmD [Fundidesulfovibrio butyratiphilus]